MNFLTDQTILALCNGGIAVFISALITLWIAKIAEQTTPSIARKVNFIGILLLAPTFLGTYFVSLTQYQPPTILNVKIAPPQPQKRVDVSAIANTLSPNSRVATQSQNTVRSASPNTKTQSETPSYLGATLLSVWALATLFLIVRREKGKQLLKFQLQSATPFPLTSQLKQNTFTPQELSQIQVVISPIGVPFVFRHQETYLALPIGINQLSPQESQSVILHELSHIRNGHLVQSELAALLKNLFVWVPSVWLLVNNLKNIQESEADTDVINQLGEGKALARAISNFSSHVCRGITPAAHRLVNSGRPLQRRVQRLMKQKRTTMRIPKITKVALGIACSAVAIGSPFAIQLNNSKAVLAQPAAKMVNWKIGHAWQYEMKFSDGTISKYTLHATAETPVKDGVVVEYQKNAMSFNGTPMVSYEYQTISSKGVFPTANAHVSNANPGFGAPAKVQLIPATSETKAWSSNDDAGQLSINTSTDGDAKGFKIVTTARIISTNQPITLANGKFRATVIETTEKADWDTTIRTRWYVENLGKVKEVLSRPNGKVMMEETLVGYAPEAQLNQTQGFIDSRPVGQGSVPPAK